MNFIIEVAITVAANFAAFSVGWWWGRRRFRVETLGDYATGEDLLAARLAVGFQLFMGGVALKSEDEPDDLDGDFFSAMLIESYGAPAVDIDDIEALVGHSFSEVIERGELAMRAGTVMFQHERETDDQTEQE